MSTLPKRESRESRCTAGGRFVVNLVEQLETPAHEISKSDIAVAFAEPIIVNEIRAHSIFGVAKFTVLRPFLFYLLLKSPKPLEARSLHGGELLRELVERRRHWSRKLVVRIDVSGHVHNEPVEWIRNKEPSIELAFSVAFRTKRRDVNSFDRIRLKDVA